MRFSDGVQVSSEGLRQRGVVSVEWQSVVLDSGSVAAAEQSPVQSTNSSEEFRLNETANRFIKSDTVMTLAKRDELLGMTVTNMPINIDSPHFGIPVSRQVPGQLTGQPNERPSEQRSEKHNSYSQYGGQYSNAHAITLHSQPLGLQPMSSGIVLASESVDEVVKIYLQQAQAYCDENEWEKAFSACQEVLKVAPTTAEAYKFLGKILQQQGRPTDAMGFYAKAITLRPNFPEVYSNLGSLYAQKGDWEEAVNYYKKAIERDPELAIA